jgi:hypothetical protein
VYAQVLADIYSVIAAIDCGTPLNIIEGEQDPNQHIRQHRPSQDTARHGSRIVDSSRAGSGMSTSRGNPSHSRVQRQTDLVSGKTSTVQNSKMGRSPVAKVDCPFYKHWLVYRDIPSPCQGCSAGSMNQVRNHVKQSHVGEQAGKIPFFLHCTRCKENFTDSQTGNSHAATKACAHTPQLRGNIITPWARLYLAIYPEAIEVPRPCKSCFHTYSYLGSGANHVLSHRRTWVPTTWCRNAMPSTCPLFFR